MGTDKVNVEIDVGILIKSDEEKDEKSAKTEYCSKIWPKKIEFDLFM